MKAVVLRRPMASNSGSYVGTPRSRSGRRSGEEISIDGRSHWHPVIGLRENLYRKPWFLPLNMGVS